MKLCIRSDIVLENPGEMLPRYYIHNDVFNYSVLCHPLKKGQDYESGSAMFNKQLKLYMGVSVCNRMRIDYKLFLMHKRANLYFVMKSSSYSTFCSERVNEEKELIDDRETEMYQ